MRYKIIPMPSGENFILIDVKAKIESCVAPEEPLIGNKGLIIASTYKNDKPLIANSIEELQGKVKRERFCEIETLVCNEDQECLFKDEGKECYRGCRKIKPKVVDNKIKIVNLL